MIDDAEIDDWRLALCGGRRQRSESREPPIDGMITFNVSYNTIKEMRISRRQYRLFVSMTRPTPTPTIHPASIGPDTQIANRQIDRQTQPRTQHA